MIFFVVCLCCIFLSLGYTLPLKAIAKPATQGIVSWTIQPSLYSNFYGGSNLELLNGRPADQQLFVLQIGDFSTKFVLPSQHSAILSLGSTLRTIDIWGDQIDAGLRLHPLKVGLGRTEAYQRSTEEKTFWLKELWLFYQSADKKMGNRIGYFPYKIGNGLIIGNAHVITTPLIGMYNYEYYINQYRPGCLMTFTQGAYQLQGYAGVISSASNSWYQNASIDRANELSEYANPYRGSFRANYMFVTQGIWKPTKTLHLTLAAIGLHVGIQQVELPYDAHMYTGTFAGLIDWRSAWGHVHIETALQRGSQQVAAIDRNRYYHIGGVQQDHLFLNVASEPGTFLWRGSQVQPFPETLGRSKNPCALFYQMNGTTQDQSTLFKNSCTRFRKEYTNSIQSFYGLGEIAFNVLQSQSLKATLGFTGIYASGGDCPNDTPEKILANRYNTAGIYFKDHCKDTANFVGIEQMYQSQFFNAFFLMQAERLQDGYSRNFIQLTSPAYTNRVSLGSSFTLMHRQLCDSWQLQFNCFNYWLANKVTKGFNYPVSVLYQMNADLAQASLAYRNSLMHDAAIVPQRYLGMEWNIGLSYTYDNSCSIYGHIALFRPGSYYQDIAGKYVSLAVQQQIAVNDFTGIEVDSTKYCIQLGNKRALLGFMGVHVCLDFFLNYWRKK